MTKHKKKHNKSAPSSAAVAPSNQDRPSQLVTVDAAPAEKSSNPLSQSVPTPVAVPEIAMAPKNPTPTSGSLASESPVLIAVRSLLKVIESYNGPTINGLMSDLKEANREMKRADAVQTKSKLAVRSACDQFIRYTTLPLASLETENVAKCKEKMKDEGFKYLRSCERSIDKISRWAVTLIFDGARILVHSDSLVVLETLRLVPKNIYFSVFIIIDNDAVKKYFEENYNIDVKTIRDAEVGTIMEDMDLVMVGAEAVLKNGGIINKVGTLPLAICAKEMNKPMYVVAESFKFSLLYPMSQKDLPKDIREDGERIRVDYTLPRYITFLVTDRGLLTPTAVCDELIELYT